MRHYKFVSWDVPTTQERADRIAQNLKPETFGVDGIYELGGWLYDGRDVLNKYIVKERDGYIREYYAVNVKVLREKAHLSRYDRVRKSPF